MDAIHLEGDHVRLSLTAGELLLLTNALNEVLHGIDKTEFDTRLGSDRENAQKLLSALTTLLDKIEGGRHG